MHGGPRGEQDEWAQIRHWGGAQEAETRGKPEAAAALQEAGSSEQLPRGDAVW